MSKAASELQKAFLAKEEVEKLVVNLEELKSEGSVTDEQYNYLKNDYSDRLTAAESAVAGQRVELKSRLDDCQRSLANSKLESDRLSLRFKVGELPLEQYEKLDAKMRKRVARTEAEVADLARLLEAKSAIDIGIVPARSGKASVGGQGFTLPEASSFTAFEGSIGEVANPRTRLLGLVGGLFLFISAFMPWGSAGAFGFSISYSAAELSGHLTAAGIIFGLLAIGGAFLTESKTRGFVHIAAGAVALLVVMIVMTVPRAEFGRSYTGAFSEGWMSVGAGLVFFIIAGIAVILGGVLERREG